MSRKSQGTRGAFGRTREPGAHSRRESIAQLERYLYKAAKLNEDLEAKLFEATQRIRELEFIHPDIES